MISVIVPTFNDEARLVACLAPLVPAAMEGLVRELIIVDGGSTDRTFEIADDAGAEFRKGEGDKAVRFAQGAQVAKGPWLLLLDPAVRLEFGWEAAVHKHIAGPRGPARFRLKRAEGGWLAAFQRPKAMAMLTLKASLPLDANLLLEGRGDGGLGQRLFRGHGRLLEASGWL